MSKRITGTLGPWHCPDSTGERYECHWLVERDPKKLASHVWWSGYRWAANVLPPPGSRARHRHSDWHTTEEAARAWADAELRQWETAP